MVDRIKARKIRFDVMDYLEQTDFVVKLADYVKNKDSYKDNLDYAQELLRQANLDTTLKDVDVICEAFIKYSESLDNYDSVDHFALLDYIEAVNETDNSDESYEALTNFIFQMLQVHKLQAKLLDLVPTVMYLGEDNCIYDRDTQEKLFTVTEYTHGKEISDKDKLVEIAYEFMLDLLITNQRKLVMNLDFDDDGYFLAKDGSDLFEKEEKQEIKKSVDEWLDMLYNVEDGEFIEDSDSENLEENVDDIVEDIDIDDDVTNVVKPTMSKESNESISRLKDTLKKSTQTINKR